jgi:hypothetical protein
MICTRILEDEASHLKFQASMLARVGSARPALFQRVVSEMQRHFLLGTILVVWMEHRAVFEAAGCGFRKFKNVTLREFAAWNDARSALMNQTEVRHKSMIKGLGHVEPGLKRNIRLASHLTKRG